MHRARQIRKYLGNIVVLAQSLQFAIEFVNAIFVRHVRLFSHLLGELEGTLSTIFRSRKCCNGTHPSFLNLIKSLLSRSLLVDRA